MRRIWLVVITVAVPICLASAQGNSQFTLPSGHSGAAQAFEVGNGVSAPVLQSLVSPVYPKEALETHRGGSVVLSVVVAPDGKCRDVRFFTSLGVDSVGMSMNYAARDAVLQWQFSPGGKDGRPVSVRIDVALFFDAIRATTGVSLDCKEVRTAAGSKVPTCSSGQIETAQFRSPDGIFEFSYPSWLVLHADAEKSGGYLCHDSIVCVEYPRELYEGYDFGSAEFWVNNNPVQVLDIRHGAQPTTTEADCLTFRTNKPVSTTVINGKKFATWFVGGAAGGTTSHIEFFRTFHNGKCYQLGTSVSISSTGYGKEDYESGRLKHFTAADEEKVRAVLDGIVKTFRFLK